MPVNTTITIRKGTGSQWSSTNPVLASGEPGYDLSNNILKIGDGVSNWNSLKNVASSSGLISPASGQFQNLSIYAPSYYEGGIEINPAINSNGIHRIYFNGNNVSGSIEASEGDEVLNFSGPWLLNNIPISVSGHSHTASNITDFDTAVASASPEEVVEYLATTNFPPSGNSTLLYIATDASRSYRWTGSQYIEVGSSASYVANHTHSASDITNFNSSVSGLLPVTSILAGSNVSVVASGTSYIISSSGTGGGGSSIKLGTIMALS